MNSKLYISLLLLTVSTLAFCMEKTTTLEKLQDNLASAKAIDDFIKKEILKYKFANPQDKHLEEIVGKLLFNQRLASLTMIGDAQRALKNAKIS